MLFANYPQFYWTTRSEQNLGIRGQRHGAVRSVTLVRQKVGRERQKHNCNFELQTERMENLDKPPSGIQPGTKIKFVGDRAEDQFPSLQGKCTSGKSGLTRSLNSLDAAVEAFSNMEETETLLKKCRKAE